MSSKFYSSFKQIIDRFSAAIGIVVLSPLLLAIAILVRYHLGKPILFRQYRPGLHGIPFVLLKFRTMRSDTESNGVLLPDAERLTPIGSWLRSTSLDELPELFNVLFGEMSFIGPRPLLMQYLPLYTLEQARRHSVKPGISGWAQINGRNSILWEEKFQLDVWYVKHQCFLLDLTILILTFWKVIFRDGITAHGSVTTFPFLGSSDNR